MAAAAREISQLASNAWGALPPGISWVAVTRTAEAVAMRGLTIVFTTLTLIGFSLPTKAYLALAQDLRHDTALAFLQRPGSSTRRRRRPTARKLPTRRRMRRGLPRPYTGG